MEQATESMQDLNLRLGVHLFNIMSYHRLYINSQVLLQLKHFLNTSYSIFSFGNIKIYVCKDIHINAIVPNCDEYGINKN